MTRSHETWRRLATSALAVSILSFGLWETGSAQHKPDPNRKVKGRPMKEFLSAGGLAALVGPHMPKERLTLGKGKFNGRGGNAFVNDPCLDPPPDATDPNDEFAQFRRTVQSEAEIAVLNRPASVGRKIVAGYNDSWGFYDNRQGLSGFSYSTDGGHSWIDGSGLPPRVPTGESPFDPGVDGYFGDPVVVVHHATETFYFASIYKNQDGLFTVAVNRGHFEMAPAQTQESVPNTLCVASPGRTGIPTPPIKQEERIVWGSAVEAIPTGTPDYTASDFADKEWLYVDQSTGTLFLTYTNFRANGETPLQLTRSTDGGVTWDGPFTIVPNLLDTFNQATQAVTTPDGRVVVAWFSRTFNVNDPNFPLTSERIEAAHSDDNGETFSAPVTVADVNPQAEPPGYNRERVEILNAPYLAVDKGQDDGVQKPSDTRRDGYGRVYVTYFDGQTFPAAPPYSASAEIHLSASSDGGASWGPEVRVNDDRTSTSHVFPTVQVAKNGEVDVGWLDRRLDPDDNVLTDTWAAASRNLGRSFGHNTRQSDVSTSWFVRADAAPNFGDYNSSDLLGFNRFVLIWADGRFRPPGGFAATPDVFFTVAKGLGGEVGEASGNSRSR
jgi:hypothetical protein